uniref:SCP domain-containing protein n=1 Tax=Panagrolaimus superbus TaxID=310955 RepID=A0A914YJ40_9BILA
MSKNLENEDETSSDDDHILFISQFIKIQNEYREKHGAPELELSEELTEQAQKWAEKLAIRQHVAYCELPGIGENITFFPANMSPKDIVDYWYNEHRKYEYETPGWQPGTNYFTQIIWRSTKEIGVGRKIVTSSDCINGCGFKVSSKHSQNNHNPSNEKQIIVAFYRPSGNNNRAGQFAANVQKPINGH